MDIHRKTLQEEDVPNLHVSLGHHVKTLLHVKCHGYPQTTLEAAQLFSCSKVCHLLDIVKKFQNNGVRTFPFFLSAAELQGRCREQSQHTKLQ